MELFVYNDFARMPVENVEAGDICAFTGITNVSIGDTICSRESVTALETITVEEPTVRMVFLVNTSPFAGREGKFVTSRNIKERLDRELERNLVGHSFLVARLPAPPSVYLHHVPSACVPHASRSC